MLKKDTNFIGISKLIYQNGLKDFFGLHPLSGYACCDAINVIAKGISRHTLTVTVTLLLNLF